MASTNPSARRRRPLLYLLIAGFVVGVVWLTRAAWRPSRGRATVTPLRDVSARPSVPEPPLAPEPPGPVVPDAPLVPDETEVPDEAGGAEQSVSPGDSALDDLTRVEGIGRRMAAALVSEGISTFEALALASPLQLRAALANQGLRFAPSLTSWPEQARLLADGDEAGFAQVSARLRRGGSAS